MAAWQALGEDGLARLGLSVEQARQAAWWVDGADGRSRGHRAIGRSPAASRGWRRGAGRLLLAPVITQAAAGAYWLIARYRYRLPGSTDACRPAAEDSP